MSKVKLKKGKNCVEIERNADGDLPVSYHNYLKAGWSIVKDSSQKVETKSKFKQ